MRPDISFGLPFLRRAERRVGRRGKEVGKGEGSEEGLPIFCFMSFPITSGRGAKEERKGDNKREKRKRGEKSGIRFLVTEGGRKKRKGGENRKEARRVFTAVYFAVFPLSRKRRKRARKEKDEGIGGDSSFLLDDSRMKNEGKEGGHRVVRWILFLRSSRYFPLTEYSGKKKKERKKRGGEEGRADEKTLVLIFMRSWSRHLGPRERGGGRRKKKKEKTRGREVGQKKGNVHYG